MCETYMRLPSFKLRSVSTSGKEKTAAPAQCPFTGVLKFSSLERILEGISSSYMSSFSCGNDAETKYFGRARAIMMITHASQLRALFPTLSSFPFWYHTCQGPGVFWFSS